MRKDFRSFEKNEINGQRLSVDVECEVSQQITRKEKKLFLKKRTCRFYAEVFLLFTAR